MLSKMAKATSEVQLLNVPPLDCSICMEPFTDPKLLPCFHTFCVQCLDNYVKKKAKNNKFQCPLCRKRITVPEGGVAEFQTNFYIQKDIRIQRDCDLCDRRAKNKCVECEEYYCDLCSRAHTNMKLTRDHRLIDTDYATDKKTIKIQKRTFCPNHPKEEVKIVCEECDMQMLCIICKLTNHAKHTSIDLNKEADEKRQQISSLVERLNSSRKQMREHEETLTMVEKQHEETVTQQKKALFEHTVNAITAIREREQQMQREMDERLKESIADMKETRSDFNGRYKAAETLVTSLESASENCSDADILNIFKQVETNVTESDSCKAVVYVWDENNDFDPGFIGKVVRKEIMTCDVRKYETIVNEKIDEPQQTEKTKVEEPVVVQPEAKPPDLRTSLSDCMQKTDDLNQEEMKSKGEVGEIDEPFQNSGELPSVISRQRSSYSECTGTLHDMIVVENVDNETVVAWVTKNVDEETTRDPKFIRAVMMAVCKSAIKDKLEGSEKGKINPQTFVFRKNLFQLYIKNQHELELQALYEVLRLVTSLDNPPGMLACVFRTLLDAGIVSRNTFLMLETKKPDDVKDQSMQEDRENEVKSFLNGLKEQSTEEIVCSGNN